MTMQKIIVEVGWSGKNFSCGCGNPEIGAVFATGKTLAEAKEKFLSALQFHIDGLKEDGELLPEWLEKGEYQLEYVLSIAALIRSAEEFTTMAAISRASGINQKQLSHYANGTKQPRLNQRLRILDGLHKIGQACLSLC